MIRRICTPIILSPHKSMWSITLSSFPGSEKRLSLPVTARNSNFPVLNIYESEEKLVKNILKLHQHAHHNGYPVKDMPPMIPAEHPQVLLSAREIEVLVLITKGLINKEIADKLNISLTTVITHRKNITEKLGIKSVSGLTIYAVMNGYIEADRI